MSDELKPEVVSGESAKISEPEIEVLPSRMKQPHSPSHTKDPYISNQVMDLGRMGLSKGNTAIACRISQYILDKYYLEDYLKGVTEMQKGLATVAIQEAMNGNTPILLHLLKTKLGWSEQQVIEHVGEIRAVVSNKPLSKEEFMQKYLEEE
jgi:hypothetical protein